MLVWALAGHICHRGLWQGHRLRVSGRARPGGGRGARHPDLCLAEQGGGGAYPGPHSEAGQGRDLLPRLVGD
jgi:hypothetical protein